MMQIQDAETKIRNKTDEELELFIEELQDSLTERGWDEMEQDLLETALDEQRKRQAKGA